MRDTILTAAELHSAKTIKAGQFDLDMKVENVFWLGLYGVNSFVNLTEVDDLHIP